MDNNPIDQIQIDIHRDRVLSEIVRQIDPHNNLVQQPDVRNLFNKAAFISNKANVLAEAIEKEARKFFIPVHPEAEEVIAAVKRKSTDSNGTQISFDLFRIAVDTMYKRKRDIVEIAISQGPGTPAPVFSKRVKFAMIRSSYPEDTSGLSAEDILFMISQFFILLLANELLSVFKGADDEEFLAEMLPESENAVVTVGEQIILSVIMQLIIFGVNEALLSQYLDTSADLGPSIKGRGKQLVEQAKARKLTPIQKMAEAYVGISDYEKILNYSIEYISSTRESGYEFWVGYLDTVEIRFQAQNLWTYAPLYSAWHGYDGLSNKKVRKKGIRKDHPSNESLFSKISPDNIGDILKSSLVGMNMDYHDQENRYLDGASVALDRIAQVLGSEFSRESICCLARFLIKIPKDKLNIIRAILKAIIRTSNDFYTLDLQLILSQLLNFSPFEAMVREAISQVQQFFSHLVSKILGMFGDDILFLLCCPLIKDMVETMLRGLVDIENRLIELLNNFAQGITLNLDRLQKRYYLINDQRYVQQLVKVIEMVLKMIDTLEVCGTTPSDDLIRQRLEEHVRDMEVIPMIRVQSDDANAYFSTAEAKEGNQKRIIAALGQPISLEANFTDILQARGDLVSEGVDEVINTVASIPGAVKRSAKIGVSNLLGELGNVSLDGTPRPQNGEKLPGLGLCYRLFSDLDVKNATKPF